MKKNERPKIALALGSGGARGLAHIGVIKTLERNGIPIDFIAGSSIGAMIGGFYAAGLETARMEEITMETDWRRIFSLVDPHLKQGLIGGQKIKDFIENHIGGKTIESCRLPFAAVCTDLKTGETIILDKGKLSQAIMASISIPLVFKPSRIDGRTLADGGLSAPVPARIARQMGADIVIAVNLDQHYYDDAWKPQFYGIANNSLGILRHHLALANVADADIVLNINIGKNIWYQFTNGGEKISAGEKAAEEALAALNGIIAEKS